MKFSPHMGLDRVMNMNYDYELVRGGNLTSQRAKLVQAASREAREGRKDTSFIPLIE